MIDAAAVYALVERVRARAPLVHNITNYVVMNNTANALLAIGASPAMVHSDLEVEDFVAISGALVVNIGTLSPSWVAAMHLAAARARERDIPWVLDPVGTGATPYRTKVAAELAARRPTVIRGNASEILVVAQSSGAGAPKGVDSRHGAETAIEAAKELARKTGGVVAVTGAIDYVTDGERVTAIANGSPLMARVTGLGCSASALTGAFLAVEPDAFIATVAALTTFAVAGEVAADGAAGPGSLQLRLLDTLYGLDLATLEDRARLP